MEAVARNKKGYFDYQITDDFEAGIALLGPEIKAIRAKQVVITGSYVKSFVNESGVSELWWVGSHFTTAEGDQTRTKKLLVHRDEIDRLVGKESAKGYTLIPLELYFRRGKAKLRVGLGLRKKAHDHREDIKRRDINREVEREFRERQKSDN